MRNNTIIIYSTVIIGIALLTYILWSIDYTDTSSEYTNRAPDFICGNVFFGPQTEEEKAGEKLFKTNCAACHRLFKDLTGPSLLSVIDKYETDSLFWNFMTSTKIKPIDSSYTINCMPFPKMKLTDASNIKSYLDASKR